MVTLFELLTDSEKQKFDKHFRHFDYSEIEVSKLTVEHLTNIALILAETEKGKLKNGFLSVITLTILSSRALEKNLPIL